MTAAPRLRGRGGAGEQINRRGVVGVRLRCPAESPGPCAGELALRRRGRLGGAAFELAAGSAARVEVRVERSRRRGLIKRAKRGRGVRVKATATTAAGEAERKLRLRRFRKR